MEAGGRKNWTFSTRTLNIFSGLLDTNLHFRHPKFIIPKKYLDSQLLAQRRNSVQFGESALPNVRHVIHGYHSPHDAMTLPRSTDLGRGALALCPAVSNISPIFRDFPKSHFFMDP